MSETKIFAVKRANISMKSKKQGCSFCGAAGQRSCIVSAVARVAAMAQVGSLAWELPHAMGAAKKKKKKVKKKFWSSHCGSAVTNLTGIHADVGSIPGLIQLG